MDNSPICAISIWTPCDIDSQKDLESVKKIHILTYSEIGQSDETFKTDVATSYSTIFLLKINNCVEGFLSLEINGHSAYGSWIAISPSILGKGFGIQLMNYVYEYLKNNQVKIISLTTRNCFRSAMKIYVTNDFDIIGMQIGMDGDTMINMRKIIKY